MPELVEFVFNSRSDGETVEQGRRLGACLQAGCTLGLIGDLGAGKTCFVKGIAEGLNKTPADEVTSPTFTIVQEYPGPVPLYHFDAYRLSGSSDLESIGFDEYIGGDGVAVIEWADRISDGLPKDMLKITIEQPSETRRRFLCLATGARAIRTLGAFKNLLEKSDA